ncbi:hypothetical protein KKA94_01455 [Patescibacteria group bacterium]|nr:hypothetical protein [Patescibacteria group bacterium]
MIYSLDQRQWKKQSISHTGEDVEIMLLPDTNNKIGVGIADNDFYVHDWTRDSWSKVTGGIYRVWRMFGYMALGYENKEIPILEKIERECKDLRINFKLLSTDEEEQEVFRTRLNSLLLGLARVQDEDKVQAKNQIEHCVLLKDSIGRLNIGVLRCRTTSSIKKLEKRVGKIGRIEPRVVRYQRKLLYFIGSLERLNRDALETIRTAIRLVYNHSIDDKKNHDAIWDAITSARQYIEEMNLKPFLNSRPHLLADATEALSHLKNRDDKDLRSVLKKIREALFLKNTRGALESAQADITLGIRFHSDVTHEIIESAQKRIGWARKVALDVDETGFKNPVCKRLIGLLSRARKILDKTDLQPSDYKEVKKFVAEALKLI